MAPPTVRVASAARLFPGETVSGDAWRIDRDEAGCRLAVIDGLGHGQGAARAAADAVAALADVSPDDPAAAVRRCHEALRGGRGAALLVARIDLVAGRIVVAGAGNVEARVRRGDAWHRIVTDRGIAGVATLRLRPVTFTLPGDDWLLLAHTDGVSNRFKPAVVEAGAADPARIAEAVLAGWARVTDDALVVVAIPGEAGRPAAG